MSWIRRETEKGTVQYICPGCNDYHEFCEDFGERTFNENFIFCRRCGRRNGTGTAPTLAPPDQWVSVKDRLPNKPGHYLVCTSINYWHGGCLDVNQEHKYHDSGTPVGYDGTTMSVLDCYYDITGDWNRVCNKHVTHWMPLPEPPDNRPPKGEKNDD